VNPTLAEVRAAAEIVRAYVPRTAVSHHVALDTATGHEVWLKHEHETPAGAFKVRGGIIYLDELLKEQPSVKGVIAASTGNHGRSIAWSSKRLRLQCVIVVPERNPGHKTQAIRALGARVIEQGRDFQEALDLSRKIADHEALHAVPSYHPWLVRGVATYALEFFEQAPELDAVLVPIGLGSGASGVLAMRDALSPKTRVLGVVSAHAPAYALSFAARKRVCHPSTTQIAEGVACSTPNEQALSVLLAGLDSVITVTDDEARQSMALIKETTGHVIEGSSALAIAALKQLPRMGRVGVILTGGNVERVMP
jgi:threonine dehydratase